MKYLVVIFLLLTACHSVETLNPIHVTETQASFDENSQDSGVKEFIPGLGFVLSDKAVQRYKRLAGVFNEDAVGLSIEDGKNILTNEGMVLFLSLNDKNLNK